MNDLKPCPRCGKKAITERWASGGLMYMVKCGNPYCPVPLESYPSSHTLREAVEEWNRRAEHG